MASRGYDISRPAQIRALASGLRQEVVDAAESLGPCSIGELARALGRRPDSLYYHVRLLLRVGLLVEAGHRPAGRRSEALLRTPGRPMRLVPSVKTTGPMVEINGSMMRLASRDFRRAAAAADASAFGPALGLYSGRTTGHLTDRQLKRIEHWVRAIQAEFTRQPARGARLHALTLVLVPLRARDGRPSPRKRLT